MGVDEEEIDKLLTSGVSSTNLYKLAANSIVVDVLYHVFRKVLIERDPDHGDNYELF